MLGAPEYWMKRKECMSRRHFRNSKTGESNVWRREGSFLKVTVPDLGIQVASLSLIIAFSLSSCIWCFQQCTNDLDTIKLPSLYLSNIANFYPILDFWNNYLHGMKQLFQPWRGKANSFPKKKSFCCLRWKPWRERIHLNLNDNTKAAFPDASSLSKFSPFQMPWCMQLSPQNKTNLCVFCFNSAVMGKSFSPITNEERTLPPQPVPRKQKTASQIQSWVTAVTLSQPWSQNR